MNRTHSIAATLRDEILRGTYGPGDRLPAERDLAGQLSVNRASIREALKQLEQMGLVRIRRGGGARVCHLHEANVDIVRHLLHIDGELDPVLAMQILDVNEIMIAGATRLAVERASDHELLEARELLRSLEEAGENMSERLDAVDGLFELITRASDNLVLRLIHNAIRPILVGDLGLLFWRILNPSRETLAEQLASIGSALGNRDAQGAEEAVRSMLRERREHLFKIFNQPDGREMLRIVRTDENHPAPPENHGENSDVD